MADTATGPNNTLVKFRGKAIHEKTTKRLPRGTKKLHARGLISDKQMAKMKAHE